MLSSCSQVLNEEEIINNSTQRRVSGHLEVLTHLERIGDKRFNLNSNAGTRNQNRRLEGFQIDLYNQYPGISLNYCALIEGNRRVISGKEGEFVGSRGRSKEMYGFAIKLTGANAKKYDVLYKANFMDGTYTYGRKKNGEYCGAQSNNLKGIESINIEIRAKNVHYAINSYIGNTAYIRNGEQIKISATSTHTNTFFISLQKCNSEGFGYGTEKMEWRKGHYNRLNLDLREFAREHNFNLAKNSYYRVKVATGDGYWIERVKIMYLAP